MSDSVMYALVALAGLATGYYATVYFSKYRNRYRLKKRIKCFFGAHELGPIRDEKWWLGASGRFRVQRCDWCDKVVHRFEINDDKIRRIY